jgi:CheY-like chemotaxis protein
MDTELIHIKKILLVEDDPEDVELILAGLEKHELSKNVAVTENGEEALDFLYRRGKFAKRSGGNPLLILLDNKMPLVNGLEVLKAIKVDKYLRTIPVVVLSSSREKSDLANFYGLGANAYVVKPLEFDKFMNALKYLGLFWATINEPPPYPRDEEALAKSAYVILQTSP